MRSIIDLSPSGYSRHFIHGDGRRWAETNCYMDVLIELVHSLGFDPVAALAVTVNIDFDVDQWTFFKFEHADLLQMYGIEVHELNPWRSLPNHVEEQVEAGRPVLVELDSYYLPDTEGSAYKSAHVKSTVAVNEISVRDNHMGYFHGQGYYHLDGEDFRAVFQMDGVPHERMLPPYVEFARLHRRPEEVDPDSLTSQSAHSLVRQLRLLPSENPFETFRKRFESDLEWLLEESIEVFHGYSFATLRQYGACFELVETYLAWLANRGEPGLDDAISSFGHVSELAKRFQFKLARSIARGKTLDLSPLDEMGAAWEKGVGTLRAAYL